MRNVHDGIKKRNAGAVKKGNGITAEEATDNSKINFSSNPPLAAIVQREHDVPFSVFPS